MDEIRKSLKIVFNKYKDGQLDEEDALTLAMTLFMNNRNNTFYPYIPTQPTPLEPYYQKEWTVTCAGENTVNSVTGDGIEPKFSIT